MHYDIHFYPVGQGLFSLGEVWHDGEFNQPLRWIYDCGTVSTQGLISDALANAIPTQETLPSVDVLAISHFDRDHISGVERLLQRASVDTLLLPYLPLEQRLIAAFSENIGLKRPLMRFFVNPVEYLRSLSSPNLSRVIFVPASIGEAPPLTDDIDVPRDNLPGGVRVETRPAADDAEAVEIDDLRRSAEGRLEVALMKERTTVAFGRDFELLPYNDASLWSKSDDHFQAAVARHRDALLRGPADDRANALADLRGVYDKRFGKSGRDRNIISLFLYAGPIGRPRPRAGMAGSARFSSANGYYERHRHWSLNEGRTGTLYTGDGFLNTASSFEQLVTYVGRSRLERLATVQVMHHGSRKNWYPGIASRLAPIVSIISSDPDDRRNNHPDKEVRNDFRPFGLAQVDKWNGLATCFHWV